MSATRLGLPLSAVLALAAAAPAQVVYPPKPEKYSVALRYRIRAGEEERIRQYRAMEAFLKKLAFEPAPKEDADLDVFDATAERTDGTIPAANVARLFESPSIVTAVLVPAGQQLPAGGTAQVRIRIASGLGAKEQADLHRQVVAHLGLMGFVENVAYDHGGHTLVRGSLPVENLYRLLKDLRTQPSGWFAPAVGPASLPLPLRAVMPIRLVEVLPDAPAAPPAPAIAPAPAGAPTAASPKLTPEARIAVEDPANQNKPLRVDLVLESPPGLAWRDIKVRIRTASGGSIEGLVGSIATVRLNKPADVAGLAALPEVQAIRLPRAGSETIRPGASGGVDPAAWLTSSHVADLHRMGYRGAGTRIIVTASGFPGVSSLIGNKLPASTRVIDLTAELTPEVEPFPAAADRAGGTAAALAAHAAAPAAELILVRVEPTAQHQLETVARSVAGDPGYSDALQSRSSELVAAREALAVRRRTVAEEYRLAFADLSDEEAPTRRRAAAKAAFDKLVADEQTHRAAAERFTALKTAVDSLHGGGVVVNTLVWDTGYPLDGLSDLSRLLEERYQPKPVSSALRAAKRPPVPVWVQAASMAVGQVWAGSFFDADANGVMEFAPATTSVPAGGWARELNFLGFTDGDGKAVGTLPAGLKIRATVQWREPHDLDAGLAPDVVFPLTLRLLRQLDPSGKTLATDEFAEVAVSSGKPVRLLQTTGSGAYEQTLEVTVPTDGVYALRVEGRPPSEIAFGTPQHVELTPRVVVEPADPASSAKGRPVFRTYAGTAVGVGVPGDSPAAFTLGVEGSAATLTGTGPGVVLATKPDFLAPGALAVGGTTYGGSGVAAGFAAGTAASLLSAGARTNDVQKITGLKPGDPLVLPPKSLATLRPRPER